MRKVATVPRIGVRRWLSGLWGSLVAAAVLVILDVVLSGSLLFSILACPVWFFLALVRSAVAQPGWALALARIGFPALTLGLVLLNNNHQLQIADATARRVVAACEAYRRSHDQLPPTLDDLVPRYLDSVPATKHCLLWNGFFYAPKVNLIAWYVVPPHLRRVYSFETRQWRYLD